MKFKSNYPYLYVEGIQFKNGEYETTKKNEIEILKRYSDRIEVVKAEEIVKVDENKEKDIETTEVKSKDKPKNKK